MAQRYLIGKSRDGKAFHSFVPVGGDSRFVKLQDMTQDDGTVVVGHSACGRALIPDHLPKGFYTEGYHLSRSPLRDAEVCPEGPLVSDAFRDLVEDFEPGRHQFIPMEIYASQTTRAKAPPEKREALIRHDKVWLYKVATRALMVVCNRLDTMDRTLSTPINERGFWRGSLKQDGARLVLSRALIGGCHLWCDRFVSNKQFMSDELARAIEARGLTGILATPVEES